MLLSKLLKSLPEYINSGISDIEISGIQPDSRKVEPGNLFIAIKGLTVDSHDLIPQALEKGAAAIIGEKDLATLASQGHALQGKYIQVPNSREALGILASAWFDHPSRKLKVIGVTGTEGKTTTSNLIYHILTVCGKKTGLISTINAKIGNAEIDTGLHVTNPEALPLQELLAKMVDAKCEYAVLETTSMGLHQGRVAGVKFEIGVLTNIAHDHLDYHKTLENYRAEKTKLFKQVNTAILNRDDNSYEYIKDQILPECKLVTYGIDTDASLKAEKIKLSAQGSEFVLENTNFRTKLLGKYNVSNTLAAIAAVKETGIEIELIKKALDSFTTPEGRLERIEEGQAFTVFVDFAHTPNSIDRVLETLKGVLGPEKQLITVFGSAGARDQLKRPAMGAGGVKHANITIFTADDPREEKVEDITDQLIEGALKEGAQEIQIRQLTGTVPVKKRVFYRELDRRKAIELAIRIAQDGDIVALLGKGHEKSLAIGDKEIPWSDQEEARRAIKNATPKK